jgi:ribulose-phosphate 3-epimerase
MVIPALNSAPEEEAVLRERIAAIPDAPYVHLDVCDGTMTPNKTWADAARWREVSNSKPVQVHLMVVDPLTHVPAWIDAGAIEIIVHLEPIVYPASGNPEPDALLTSLRALTDAAQVKLIIAGTPLLPASVYLTYQHYADACLVLTVKPGFAGQEMDPLAIGTIAALHEGVPQLPIWVDGGVNSETLQGIKAAGATHAVAAKAIFESENPAAAWTALQ